MTVVALSSSLLFATKTYGAEDAVTWESKGKVTFVDGFFSSFKNLPQGEEMEVEIEEAQETPGMYRLVNPYAEWSAVKDGKVEYDAAHNYYFVIHAEDPDWVWGEGGDLGVIMDGMPVILHSNVQALIDAVGIETMKSMKPEAGGEYLNGVISFPPSFKNGYDVTTFAVTARGVQWTANSEGKVRVRFPGGVEPDYSLTVETDECIDVDEPVNVKVTAGDAITSIKVRVMPESRIGQGTYFDMTVEEGVNLESGETYSYPAVAGQDIYTVSVVGLNANGRKKAEWLTWVSVHNDETEGWKEIGDGTFTDPFLPIFGYCEENHTYTVKVEANDSKPGIYRVADIFKNHPVAAESGKFCQRDHTHYMYVDVTDPEAVVIKRTNSGLDIGHGMLTLWSVIDGSGLDAATLTAYGYQLATYDEATRTINFPQTSMYAGCSLQNYCELMLNWTGGSLVVPEYSGVGAIESDVMNSAIEYFDLTGNKVTRPGKGLYIMVKGGKAEKVML